MAEGLKAFLPSRSRRDNHGQYNHPLAHCSRLDRPWTLPAPDLHVWAALAGIALLSTVLAYMLYFRILATVGATNRCW